MDSGHNLQNEVQSVGTEKRTENERENRVEGLWGGESRTNLI